MKTGFSRERRSFVQVLGGRHLDASALMFGLDGFIAGNNPRMTSTISAIQRVLGRRPFVYRYLREQGTGVEEGAFLPCSFWLVEALAAAGRADEARHLLDQLHGPGQRCRAVCRRNTAGGRVGSRQLSVGAHACRPSGGHRAARSWTVERSKHGAIRHMGHQDRQRRPVPVIQCQKAGRLQQPCRFRTLKVRSHARDESQAATAGRRLE